MMMIRMKPILPICFYHVSYFDTGVVTGMTEVPICGGSTICPQSVTRCMIPTMGGTVDG